MQAKFYINNSDNRVVNKDLTLIETGEPVKEYLGQLIERVSSASEDITASSYSTSWGNYAPWQAFNGVSPSDLRSPSGDCWTAYNSGQWIQYHFNISYYFNKIGIKAFSNYAGAWTGHLKIEGSKNGTTFTNLLTNGDTVEITAPLQSILLTEYDLNDTETWRYIRITVVEGMSVDYSPSLFIDEIYVYGGTAGIPDHINITFKDNEDKGQPTLEIAYTPELLDANYCYIEELGHYYYLSEPVLGKQRIYFTAKSDLLMTYKNDILNLDCIIARQENEYNAYLNDDKYPVLNKQDVNTLVFPYGFADTEEMLLIVNG